MRAAPVCEQDQALWEAVEPSTGLQPASLTALGITGGCPNLIVVLSGSFL